MVMQGSAFIKTHQSVVNLCILLNVNYTLIKLNFEGIQLTLQLF